MTTDRRAPLRPLPPHLGRVKAWTVAVALAVCGGLFALPAPPATAATAYQVTATKITYTVTYAKRVQTGTGGGELQRPGSWSGEYVESWNQGDCPNRDTNNGARWTWTDPNYDLSQYRFNPDSNLGVQRRACNQHQYGPSAPNANCKPADCPVKFSFYSGSYTPPVYAPTYPIYGWQAVSEPGLTNAKATERYGYCQGLTTSGETKDCARATVRGTPEAPYLADGCPASTPDVEYTCHEVQQPGSGSHQTTTQSGITITLKARAHRVLKVRVIGAPKGSRVILQERQGNKWASYPVAQVRKSHKLAKRWKVTPGHWRVAVKPRKKTGLPKVVSQPVLVKR